MRWTPVTAEGLPDLILFDGDCVPSSYWARWVHEHDADQRFRFVAIQSEAGRVLAARFGVAADNPESNVVVVGERAYFKFDTVMAILASLRTRHALLMLRHAPKPMRDWLYDRIARNRYRLFGRRTACLAPDAAIRARLIERATDLAAA